MNFSGFDLFRQASGVPTAVLHISLILVLAWVAQFLAQKLLRALRDYSTRFADSSEQGKRIETLGRVAKHVSNLVIVFITGMLILGVLGISIAPILGAAGVVGIAVGFAAQNLIKDYFTGFFLLLENQLRIGDAAELGGKTGVVEEITLRFVRLRSEDGSVHFVPNSLVSILSNRSLSDANLFIDVGVSAQGDVNHAIQVLTQACAALGDKTDMASRLIEPAKVLGVHSIGEHVVQLRVLIKSRLSDQALLRRELLALVLQHFKAAGVALADLQGTNPVPPPARPPAPA